MLRKCLLFMVVITMGALFMACGDKYGEAVDVNKQFAAAMEEYVMALDKAGMPRLWPMPWTVIPPKWKRLSRK